MGGAPFFWVGGISNWNSGKLFKHKMHSENSWKFGRKWKLLSTLVHFSFFIFSNCSSVCQSVFWGSLQFKAENWERRKKQSKELWLWMCAISLFAMPHGNHSKHRKIKKTCQRQSGDLTTLWHTISCCSLTNWETQNLTLINLTWLTESDNGQPSWCLKYINVRPRSNNCLLQIAQELIINENVLLGFDMPNRSARC